MLTNFPNNYLKSHNKDNFLLVDNIKKFTLTKYSYLKKLKSLEIFVLLEISVSLFF